MLRPPKWLRLLKAFAFPVIPIVDLVLVEVVGVIKQESVTLLGLHGVDGVVVMWGIVILVVAIIVVVTLERHRLAQRGVVRGLLLVLQIGSGRHHV